MNDQRVVTLGHDLAGRAPAGPPRLITPGVIATAVNQPLHRVLRILATRPHIQVVARAGTLRLYGKAAIPLVREELNAIDQRRRSREVATEQAVPHE
jgi:hypothetical protein